MFDELGNVFEPVIAHQHPEIAEVIQQLRKTSRARLTGTGACVFAAYNTQQEAQQAMADLPEDCSAFIARGLNQSPLQAMLESAESD